MRDTHMPLTLSSQFSSTLQQYWTLLHSDPCRHSEPMWEVLDSYKCSSCFASHVRCLRNSPAWLKAYCSFSRRVIKVARQSVPHFPPSATGEPPEEEGGHGGHDGAKFFCHLMAMLSYSCRAYNGSRSCTLYRMVGENGWNLVVGFPTATGSITTIVPNDVHHTSSSVHSEKNMTLKN